MKFGENLYNLRKREKMSQEELAEKVSVSRQSVSKWESGAAYPEMNRILELCKIFHCKLNDLVNDSILDSNLLDEEIKMNAVKFSKEKQSKLKFASNIIFIYSKILQVLTMGIGLLMLVFMFFVPHIINNSSVTKNKMTIVNNDIKIKDIDSARYDSIVEFFNGHSNFEIIVSAEVIIVCLIACVLILSFAMSYLSKLFKNINEGDTPFTLENMRYIKKITILFVLYIFLPNIFGTMLEWFTKIDLGIDYELSKFIYLLIIGCIYYVFDYGHQIQLDSKGKLYGIESK